MRCSCCDKALSGYESTLRHAKTREFLDTCTKCLDGLGIPIEGREDLEEEEEYQEDISFEEDEDEF